VLEGNLTVYVGDTRVDLAAGGFAFGPTGVPHTFIGAGSVPARVLVGLSPFQFEGFLREAGQPAPARVLPPPHASPPPGSGADGVDREAPRGHRPRPARAAAGTVTYDCEFG
jgi:Mannose-6-phosphate isomerase